MNGQEIRTEGDVTYLVVDKAIYSKEALLQACYWFTDRAYLLIARYSPDLYRVAVLPKPTCDAPGAQIAGDLANALLDSQLRLQITQETEKIREIIFTKAFSEGGLLDEPAPGDDRDPVEVKRIASLNQKD